MCSSQGGVTPRVGGKSRFFRVFTLSLDFLAGLNVLENILRVVFISWGLNSSFVLFLLTILADMLTEPAFYTHHYTSPVEGTRCPGFSTAMSGQRSWQRGHWCLAQMLRGWGVPRSSVAVSGHQHSVLVTDKSRFLLAPCCCSAVEKVGELWYKNPTLRRPL